MFNRRQFLTRTLEGLVAGGPELDGPAVRVPDRAGRRAGQGHHPRRPRDDRRQRRPQHRHSLRRRPVPQGPAHAAPDQGRGHPPGRSRRPELRHAGLPADVGARAAGGRAGRRLSEPRALALRGDGHLAVGRSQGDSRPAGWAGPRPRPTTTRAASPSCTSARTACRWPWPGRRAAGPSPSTTRTRSASSWAAATSVSRRPAAGCWRTWRRRRARLRRTTWRRSCSGGRCRR